MNVAFKIFQPQAIRTVSHSSIRRVRHLAKWQTHFHSAGVHISIKKRGWQSPPPSLSHSLAARRTFSSFSAADVAPSLSSRGALLWTVSVLLRRFGSSACKWLLFCIQDRTRARVHCRPAAISDTEGCKNATSGDILITPRAKGTKSIPCRLEKGLISSVVPLIISFSKMKSRYASEDGLKI